MEKDCIFCKISSGEMSSVKLYENNSFFSIKDINPKTKGHSLVISKKHFETIVDLPMEFGNDLIDCIKNTINILIGEEKFSGFNIIQNNFRIAGQIIPHLHFHIIPRREEGDFNVGV